jgi:hypothetical protein
MRTSEQINEIAAALAKAQSAIKDASKDRQGYGYKYADLAAVLQIVRPALTAEGIAVLQDTETVGDHISVATRLVHSSGQWLESEHLALLIEAKKGLSAAQCAGSVVTYARRYSLAALVGVAQEDDDAAKDKDSAEAAERVQKALDAALATGGRDGALNAWKALPEADKTAFGKARLDAFRKRLPPEQKEAA